jgi:UDP-2,3-diacylglucosamine hydrolase
MKSTLFISDLHLSASRPPSNRMFFAFLDDIAPHAAALYILGDLFEHWAGDDDLADPLNQSVVSALRRLHERGVAVYFMHGNRDFLIGAAFCQASGVVLLNDPTLLQLHGAATLLMHGDTLCTDDIAYQRFRAQVRDPAWQNAFLARPLAQRKTMIEALRSRSETAKQGKSEALMDVTQAAVESALREYDCARLIHGHTHRPAHHFHRVDANPRERWVLTDWYERGGYLRCDADGCEAITLAHSVGP